MGIKAPYPPKGPYDHNRMESQADPCHSKFRKPGLLWYSFQVEHSPNTFACSLLVKDFRKSADSAGHEHVTSVQAALHHLFHLNGVIHLKTVRRLLRLPIILTTCDGECDTIGQATRYVVGAVVVCEPCHTSPLLQQLSHS